MTPQQVQQMIDQSITKALLMPVKKYGDTPTDNNQLTPKRYVTSVISSVVAGLSSVSALKVTDGVRTVYPTSVINFLSGATVSVIGTGSAGITINQPSVAAALPDTSLQYNNGGDLGGTGFLYTDGGTNPFVIRQDATVVGGAGTQATTVFVTAASASTGKGGDYHIQTGTSTSIFGGDIYLSPGSGGGVGGGNNLNAGDVIVNRENTIASRNGGFMVVPLVTGTPTGAPSNTPAMAYDSSADKIWIYNGSWKSVTLT